MNYLRGKLFTGGLGILLILFIASCVPPRKQIIKTGPIFSPDGGKIAFMSNEDGDWEIFLMDVDGSRLTQLTNNSANDVSPHWSPDGKSITFSSDRSGEWQIYVMNVDGSGVKMLTMGPKKS